MSPPLYPKHLLKEGGASGSTPIAYLLGRGIFTETETWWIPLVSLRSPMMMVWSPSSPVTLTVFPSGEMVRPEDFSCGFHSTREGKKKKKKKGENEGEKRRRRKRKRLKKRRKEKNKSKERKEGKKDGSRKLVSRK